MAKIDYATIDLATVFASMGGAGVIAFLAVRFLGGKAVDDFFSRRSATYKTELDKQLERHKTDLRKLIETELADEAAERSYRFDAKKRLYEAIGPLRFQLGLACIQYNTRLREVAEAGGSGGLNGDRARNMLFQTGRLVAIVHLIERQMNHADFSVDRDMLRLLRFGSVVDRALGNQHLVRWLDPAPDTQPQWIDRDQLQTVAVGMVVVPSADRWSDKARVARPDEFNCFLKTYKPGWLEPLRGMIDRLDVTQTPIAWVRFVALGEACAAYIDGDPVSRALEPPRFDAAKLLSASGDKQLIAHAGDLIGSIRGLRATIESAARADAATTGDVTR